MYDHHNNVIITIGANGSRYIAMLIDKLKDVLIECHTMLLVIIVRINRLS